jgi:hypothetical protein
MEIGKPEETVIVEPLEDPFRRETPEPEKTEPVELPEPEKVPA